MGKCVAGIINPVLIKSFNTGSAYIAIRLFSVVPDGGRNLMRFTSVRSTGVSVASVTLAYARQTATDNVLTGVICGYAQSGVSFYTDGESLYAYMPNMFVQCVLEYLHGNSDYETLTEFTPSDYTKIEVV